jgi:hypothetical protein
MSPATSNALNLMSLEWALTTSSGSVLGFSEGWAVLNSLDLLLRARLNAVTTTGLSHHAWSKILRWYVAAVGGDNSFITPKST